MEKKIEELTNDEIVQDINSSKKKFKLGAVGAIAATGLSLTSIFIPGGMVSTVCLACGLSLSILSIPTLFTSSSKYSKLINEIGRRKNISSAKEKIEELKKQENLETNSQKDNKNIQSGDNHKNSEKNLDDQSEKV